LARRNIICGIDIGNSEVKTIIGEFNRETNQAQVIGIGNADSNGMRRSVVIDMEETINDVRDSVNRAQSMAGVKVDRAYVALNGLHIKSHLSHGVIAVSRADNEISQFDIDRVIDAASAVSLPANREIIHVIPRNFIIDGQEHIKNALGMKGVRLEADVLLIEGLAPYIRNLAKCVNANGIEVAEFVYGPLATAKSVLDKHQLEHGVLNVDFGGGVSTLALFHEGDLVHSAVLPIGSRHITNDIAIALKTSMENAEEIKREYGFAGGEEHASKETIDLSDLVEEEFTTTRKHIAKIVSARISELFEMIDEEIRKVPQGHLLPAGVILAGGGANLAGLAGFTKDKLKLSVRVGRGQNDFFFDSMREKTANPSYATALGLIIWGFEKEYSGKTTSSLNPLTSGFAKKAGKWLKNFMP
jgi:cell division protein FtsA